MKVLVEDRFDDIGAAITNSGEKIDLDLMEEGRKRTYKEALGGDDNAEGDLNDDMMGKSIYLLFSNSYMY